LSQSGILSEDSTPARDVEFITGDTGGAVGPDALHNINLVGGANVTTTGTPGTNTIRIDIGGGYEGTGQTIGAVTDDLITIALGAAAGTYKLHVKVVGFEATTPAGCVYEITAGVRTTGAAAVLIGVPVVNSLEEAALVAANATVVVAANTAIIRVTGVGALTIDWNSEADTIFQG
jgi:hypothetical protein